MMHAEKVVVLDDAERILVTSPGIDRMRARAEVTVYEGGLADIPDEDLIDVTVLMAVRERSHLGAEALDRLPNLKLILQTGGHAYHLDGAQAARRGITVTLGRRAQGPRSAVPELTFALAIGALRGFREAVPLMSEGEWPTSLGRTLGGKTIGVLGFGRHGRNVARIADAFGMTVKVWARSRSGTEEGVKFVSFDDVISTSDVISIHLRLSNESRGLLGRDELASMKSGSVLVNTSRGAIVDESALIDALKNGPLGGAGLDVFTQEPLAADSELRTLANALITPHIGWTVAEVLREFADIASEQFYDFLDGSLDSAELMHNALR